MGRYSKHSIDFKNLVVRLYTQQKSFRKTSRVTGVPRSTICNWYHVSPVSRRNTYYKKCTPVVKNEIEQLILANPFLSSLDIIRIIKDRLNISIAASTARRQRKSLGFTRKRPSRVPTNHDLDIKRKNFAIAMADANMDNVISIDESSFCYDLPKTMGYSKRGRRVPLMMHTHNKHRMTLIMAVTTKGIVHWDLYRGSTTSQRFVNFIRSLPHQDNGSKPMLLMDNAAFHKTNEVIKTCDSMGLRPVFLPPYTPFFQPIEHVFGVLKHHYSKIEPEAIFSWDDLRSRVAMAIDRLQESMFDATFMCCHKRMKNFIQELKSI